MNYKSIFHAQSQMNTVSISIANFTPSFHGDGYVMSYVTQTVLLSRIIQIVDGNGNIGVGEIINDPGLNIKQLQTVENRVLEDIDQITLQDIPMLIQQFRSKKLKLNGLAFGLETAYLDLISRTNEVPLFALLGGCLCNDMPDYLSISCSEPEVMKDRIRIDGINRDVIQIKMNGVNIDADLNRIDASLSALGKHQTLLVDFNGALNPHDANIFIDNFSDQRILWEEPCKTYEDNRNLAEKSGASLLFDQCLKSLNIITRACSEGVMAGACIKADGLGGLGIARTARDICIDSGVPIRVDGLWCGPIAAAATLHLATGTPTDLLISACDLCDPLVITEDWGAGIVQLVKGRIAANNLPGHGVTPPDTLKYSSI
ncbi:MAG: mandelate racemase/muconate lactonizing enzyme family protein [Gammaproteobacteria bacterium]|nr:mandelate racemase/muconate lactonizing enzyme family protein [Gammaproteobacteria bacterium]